MEQNSRLSAGSDCVGLRCLFCGLLEPRCNRAVDVRCQTRASEWLPWARRARKGRHSPAVPDFSAALPDAMAVSSTLGQSCRSESRPGGRRPRRNGETSCARVQKQTAGRHPGEPAKSAAPTHTRGYLPAGCPRIANCGTFARHTPGRRATRFLLYASHLIQLQAKKTRV